MDARSTMMAAEALTKNQAAVLAALHESHRPMSAYQILDQIAGSGVRAPAQVYRALERLQAMRLVHRIETLNAYLACDHGPHAEDVAFAICEACGSVTELPLAPVAGALATAAAAAGFSFHEAHVELRGACLSCHAAGDKAS